MESYCAASREMVSVEKPSIFFSPNSRVGIQEQISTILNIMTGALSDRYLGLPAMVGIEKTDCFQYLVDQVN